MRRKKGISSIWLADEIPWKEPWMILTLIAMGTKRTRMGPGVTNPFLRNPAYIAQALGTLDEISKGRTFCGLAMGAPYMLKQCNIEPKKPFSAVREATNVIRMMLTGKRVSFNGEHFNYSGIQTCAKSIKPVPIYIGGITGPLSFQIAGEIGDGVCAAHAVTPDQIDYIIKNVNLGLRRSNRDSEEFKIIDIVWFSVNQDEQLAHETIKPIITYYLPWLTDSQLEKYNIDRDEFRKVSEEVHAGNLREAIRLTSDKTVDSLSIVGNTEMVIGRFEELISRGVNEIVFSMVDNDFLRRLIDIKVKGAPSIRDSLDFCRRYLLPHFQE